MPAVVQLAQTSEFSVAAGVLPARGVKDPAQDSRWVGALHRELSPAGLGGTAGSNAPGSSPAGCAERGGWHGLIVHQELHSLFSFKMILMR